MMGLAGPGRKKVKMRKMIMMILGFLACGFG
jgi:hypothetical protein